MSNHQAAEQMIGYLYQVRYALKLLLDNDNPDFQISIEKFDDIAFSYDGTPIELIQLKHHIQKNGNLTDASIDLWRTLKVWIDSIEDKPEMVEETNFLIITTSTAPENSAASYLKSDGNRNPDAAYEMLKEIASKSNNKENKKNYEAFSNANDVIIKKLFSSIYVIDNESNIVDVENDLHKQIRYSCIPKYEEAICERIEGWWYKHMIDALCSENPVFVTQNQIRELIVAISHEYSEENLPIDVPYMTDIEEAHLGIDERIFYEQLKLISLGDYRMRMALRDYYRAFMQRANWVRNDLLYINELEKYEERLIDEWEHYFAAMVDELNQIVGVTEDEKVKEGRKLFSSIENKDIRIRPKCQEAFVMRGTYHILANQLKVGWHVDFLDRLKNLLSN